MKQSPSGDGNYNDATLFLYKLTGNSLSICKQSPTVNACEFNLVYCSTKPLLEQKKYSNLEGSETQVTFHRSRLGVSAPVTNTESQTLPLDLKQHLL